MTSNAQSSFVIRLKSRFPNLPVEVIQDTVKRLSEEPDRAIAELEYASKNPSSRGPSAAPVVSRQSSSATVVPDSTLLPRPSKPKKNAISAIYANRDKPVTKAVPVVPVASASSISTTHSTKKKRNSGSESEADAGASDEESEMDWSGDEGRKRKKRKGNEEEDELDAEGAALKAFNEVTADVLTGTIGQCLYSPSYLWRRADGIACSLDQANKIISLRPYNSVDELQSKLNKARGVSVRLFEQYTEIMEGYVQIDSCLNKCERIANDVATTLAVWRGAGMGNDSVVGTPKSDGMNDVKVDVGKVSELLRNETDMKKRKILSQYIQTQPSKLSEGTVLKDYQLLGVNWLNMLWEKKIGCILADEMGMCTCKMDALIAGLGKTIQVIAFLAHLKANGVAGPHMIYVP